MNWKIGIPKIDSAFKIGIFLLIVKTMAASSQIIPYSETVDTLLSVAAALFFVISILLKRFSKKILFICLLIVLVALYTVLRLQSMFVLLVVITCLALRREDIRETVRIMLFYGTTWFVLHTAAAIFLSFFGLEIYSVADGQIRYHFGYSHPNTFSLVLVNLTVMWVWINYDRIKVRSVVAILVIHLVCYGLTTCRTALLACVVMALLLVLFYRKEKRQKLLRNMAAVCMPLAALAIYCLMRMYLAGQPLAYMVDTLLSTRIKLGAYALEHFGLSFWGQDLTEITVVWDSNWRLSGHTFDNVYSYLMCSYGIVWLLVLVFLFYRVALIGDEKTNIMIILWTLYGISEVHILDPYRFFPIMLVATLYEYAPPKRKRRFRFTWRTARRLPH